MQTEQTQDIATLMTVREFAESDIWRKYERHVGTGVRALYRAIEAGWLSVHRVNARVLRIDPKRAEQDIKDRFLTVPKLSNKMKGKLIFC